MKGRGFHQSDAAHHLHWGLCGLGSVFGVGYCFSLSVLSPRLKLAWKVDPCFIREGTAKASQASGRLNRDWVRWSCRLCLVSVELRVTMAVSFPACFSTSGPLEPGPRLQGELILQLVTALWKKRGQSRFSHHDHGLNPP